MLVRGFEAWSLAVNGGSAFTKNGRPASSATLAIWPLAPRAKTVAQRTSVARRSPAVIAVRFFIILPWERQQQFWSLLQNGQFSTLPHGGQCPFSTRAPRLTVYPGDRLAMALLAKSCWRGCRTGLGRKCKRIPTDTLLAPRGLQQGFDAGGDALHGHL